MRARPFWILPPLLFALAMAAGAAEPPASAPAANVDADAGRPELPARLQAWRKLGFGIFIHWGLYSELGGVWQGKPVTQGYSEQIQSFANIPPADYANVAGRFSAAKFDADAICGLAKEAGARYIVVTSKHHDGFAMFDTTSTDFNVVRRTPFGKDPLKLLSAACRKIGLGFGVYFSLVDWHAGHAFDPDNNNPIPASMEPLIEQQLRELMTNYGPITEVWFDMSSPTPAQSRRFAAIVRELQPQAAINGRLWNNQGDFVTLGDNEAPPRRLQPPFEVPASIYHETWGYRGWQKREDAPGKVRELVHGLAEARARGGNYLLNIGPMGDGSVVPFEAQVLRGIGAWLRAHPAALDLGPAAAPERIAAPAADGSVRIARGDWSAGTSFGFRNGYSTQYPTTVVLSSAFALPRAQAVTLRFDGAVARGDRRYRIAVGGDARDVDGKQLGAASGVGPFQIAASGPVPITIRLADPAFAAEDIGLDFGAVELTPTSAKNPR